ncbi:MAG TPA: glycosyltransferase, partial [bacterium]|nr:glycosyltransferase [bacterium]
FLDAPDRRETLGIPAGVPVVGMIGRLVPDKDPVGFVAAARAVAGVLPEARFLVVGDGPLRPRVQEAVEREGLAGVVIMTGERPDIPELLATMDVVVLTSRWEGMPMVVLEAMASARPVVAPRLGGLTEVIEDGVTGRLTPPGDERAIAEAVIALLRDAPARRRMGEQGRARVRERFSLERMVAQTLAVYREVRG